MKIINPLYDNAFKYLMDNDQIAKKVLSIILGQSIISLQSKPQEISVEPDHYHGVARYDFKAIIRNQQGIDQCVLIELQKYRNPNPSVRFREYLAENYKKEETIKDARGNEVQQPLPIITIYILGYKVTKAEVLALKVDRVLRDIIWDETLNEMPDFVELLTHTSIILQVDAKPGKSRNTRLEKFIKLFVQKLKYDTANYVIDVEMDDLSQDDAEITDIVHHLGRAIMDEKVLRGLKYEQAMEEGIKSVEREIAETKIHIELAVAKAEQAEAKAEQAEAKAEQAEAKAERNRQIIANTVRLLHQNGVDIKQIAANTGLSTDEILSIIQ